MKFPEKVKALRQARDISQKELCNIIGITTKQLQRYEAGTSEPTMSKMIALADYFDVPLDYLAGTGLYGQLEEFPGLRDAIIDAFQRVVGPDGVRNFESILGKPLPEIDDVSFAKIASAVVEKVVIHDDHTVDITFFGRQ